MDYKKEIESEYRELILLLKNAQQKIRHISTVNKESTVLKSNLCEAFENQIETISSEMEHALHNMYWDKLVIALFGETNAGKSTIIETFRILFQKDRTLGKDGIIVGDGQCDFTKDYHEYELSISGCPFILIDVPGIEGEESEYSDSIKTALSKAHCVFYVQGHNKAPDERITKKIKSYLGDWVQVYSIYNIRGSVSDYDEEDERKTLLSDAVLKTEKLIKSCFEKNLGEDVYKGNVSLQGLLAMCAKASFAESRESFKKNQLKLIKYFGSEQSILEFSQFQTLITLVDDKAANFSDEIKQSNQQKLFSFMKYISSQMKKFLVDSEIEHYKKKISQFSADVEKIAEGVCDDIRERIKGCINRNFNDLQSSFNSIVDHSENKKDDLKKAQKAFIDNIDKDIIKVADDKIKYWNDCISLKCKDLDGFRIDALLSKIVDPVKSNIDLSKALEELDIGLEDVGSFLLEVGGFALAGTIFGPIGIAVGAGVGMLSHFAKSVVFGDGGASDAKKEGKKKIDDAKNSYKKKIQPLIDSLCGSIENEKNQLLNIVLKEKSNLESIEDIVTSLDEAFRQKRRVFEKK